MKRNRSGPRLWTKNFSCITIATVLSAIGGEAMNLPISLLVFDETKSNPAVRPHSGVWHAARHDPAHFGRTPH